MSTDIGAVCGGTGKRYHIRVRWYGYRKYQIIGPPSKTYRAALRRLAKEMETGDYKRGDVLMSTDYYAPMQLIEMVRR